MPRRYHGPDIIEIAGKLAGSLVPILEKKEKPSSFP